MPERESAGPDPRPGSGRPELPPGCTGRGSITQLACLSVAFVLGGVGLLWFAQDGVRRGVTVLPSKLMSHRRPLERSQEPGSFWASIALYGLTGGAAVALGAWGAGQTWKLTRRRGRD